MYARDRFRCTNGCRTSSGPKHRAVPTSRHSAVPCRLLVQSAFSRITSPHPPIGPTETSRGRWRNVVRCRQRTQEGFDNTQLNIYSATRILIGHAHEQKFSWLVAAASSEAYAQFKLQYQRLSRIWGFGRLNGRSRWIMAFLQNGELVSHSFSMNK